MKLNIIKFPIRGDNDGWLTPIEEQQDIPFDIKRVYYIYGTKEGVVRGRHAHIKLDQILITVSGSCKVLMDNGTEKKVVQLNTPDKGLFVGEKIWHDMYDFSSDCVLLVLASDFYDERKYIRDYEEFLKLVSK